MASACPLSDGVCAASSPSPASARRRSSSPDAPTALRRRPLPRVALARHRTVPRRPHQGRGRHPVAAERLLHRRRERRRLEDDRRRPHVDADLRRPADRLDRRASPSRRPIRTSSTSAAAKDCSGRISRPATASTSPPTPAARWTHLGLRDGQQIPQIIVDPRNPESTVRRRARASVRPERRARRVPIDRRRPHVRAGALQGREHRRGRRRVRSGRSADTIYAVLWEARQGPWENGAWQRARQRAVQIHRRRHDVAAARRRACRRSPTGSDASASPSRRAIRNRLYAVVDAGRERRASTGPTTRARHWTRVNADPRVVGRPAPTSPTVRVDPKNPDIVYVAEHRRVEIDRRRQDVHRVARRAGRRRLPQASGSIPIDPDVMILTSRSGRDRHASTAARRGAPGTTSRRRSSTT